MGVLISRDILVDYLRTISDEKKRKLYLVNQCAPVIKGLKPATLLMIQNQSRKEYHILAREWKLEWFVLYEGIQKSAVLLYHLHDLECCLNQAEVEKFLEQSGYKPKNLDDMLRKLGRRIEKYYESNQQYPHEIGLFLGYPIEDVMGFMKEGQQVLYRGYWNVYYNVEQAKSTFTSFDRAREELLWEMLRE